MRRPARTLLPSIVLAAILFTTGCTYMKNRGNDALDVFDIGISVSPKATPDFAVYSDFFGRIPAGGAYVDNAKLLGIGNRHVGWLDYENKSWGAVAVGSEKAGCGKFNAQDPYQAREDQRGLTERPRFNTGTSNRHLPGILFTLDPEANQPPPLQFAAWDNGVHLGYIGVLTNFRPVELIDFLAGWTTLDFMNDDGAEYRKQM